MTDTTPRRVGHLLKERHDPVYAALPTAAKTALCCGESGDLPLTVREGKVWLRDYLKAHSEVSLETIVERITKMAPEISVSEYFGNADIEKPDIQREDRTTILHASQVSYGYEKGKPVLRDFDWKLPRGSIYCIMGSNGSGKTSMLNLICGSISADAGKVIVNGTDITGQKEYMRHRKIGRVYQNPSAGTCPNMTVLENMAVADLKEKGYGLNRCVRKSRENAYREMLSGLGLGLEDKLETKVGSLSGGQRQAITLLMASIQKPKLLLLDEHTAALDPKTAAKVLEISDKIISDNHLTAMMVTHNMKDAIVHGNRLIMMHEGKVILNISGEEKKKLTVEDLLHQFEKVSGQEFANDKALLS